jgi:alpha-1,3-mannosyltransferase
MASLKDRYPQMRLEWVGADFAGLRSSLERRVVELGLGGRVRFHGATSREELYRLLERAQLFVSASAYEGFGLSTIEAMSAATVPVVTAVGAHPNVIEHGVSGSGGRRCHGASGIYRACAGDVSGRNRSDGRGRPRSDSTISWTEIAPQYEQLYRQVLEIRGSAA